MRLPLFTMQLMVMSSNVLFYCYYVVIISDIAYGHMSTTRVDNESFKRSSLNNYITTSIYDTNSTSNVAHVANVTSLASAQNNNPAATSSYWLNQSISNAGQWAPLNDQQRQRYRQQDKAKTKLINLINYTSKVNLGLSSLIKSANDVTMTTTVLRQQQSQQQSHPNIDSLTKPTEPATISTTAQSPSSSAIRSSNVTQASLATKRLRSNVNTDADTTVTSLTVYGHEQQQQEHAGNSGVSGDQEPLNENLNGAADFMQMMDEMISIQQNVSMKITQANEIRKQQQQQQQQQQHQQQHQQHQQKLISKRQGQLQQSNQTVSVSLSAFNEANDTQATVAKQKPVVNLQKAPSSVVVVGVNNNNNNNNSAMVATKAMVSKGPLMALTSLFSQAKTALMLNKLLPQSQLISQSQLQPQHQQQLQGKQQQQQLTSNRKMFLWNPLAVTLANNANKRQAQSVVGATHQQHQQQQQQQKQQHQQQQQQNDTNRFRRDVNDQHNCVGGSDDQVALSTINQHQQCLENEQTVAKVIEHNLPSTLNEMERLCNSTQFLMNVCWPPASPSMHKLSHKHNSLTVMRPKCSTTTYKSTLSTNIKERVDWISVNLCIDHEFKQDYVDNVQCLSKWGAKYQPQSACARDYERIIRVVSHDDQHQPPDTTNTTNITKTVGHNNKRPSHKQSSAVDELEGDLELRTLCCSFDVFLRCISAQAAKDCGQSASKFVGRFFGKLAGEDVRIHCSQYNYIGSVSSNISSIATDGGQSAKSLINGQSMSICQDWQKHKQQPARRNNSTGTAISAGQSANGKQRSGAVGAGNGQNSQQSRPSNRQKQPTSATNGPNRQILLLPPGQTTSLTVASTATSITLTHISLLTIDSWPLLFLLLALSLVHTYYK